MIIGILKEIRANENRVSITPPGVEFFKHHGHTVLVQRTAGRASGFTDDLYRSAGAEMVDDREDIFSRAEMLLRVREPQPSEISLLREDQIYFSFLHLAASEETTRRLIQAGNVNIAYETIQKDDGTLPLLTPMSEVSGAMAIYEGAKYLEMAQGGDGVLLGGVPGVDPGMVLIIGGGVVGIHAARMASGLGAKVCILEKDLNRMRYLSDVMPGNCFTLMSSPAAIRELLATADVVIGAVLEAGGKCPILVTREMLSTMKPGAVLVDVAIDQGGCFETSRETTHAEPTYIVDGIVHYAVGNMPGALPRTSTLALTNATLSYALAIADKGWKAAFRENRDIARGANVVKGQVTCRAVADTFGLAYTPIETLL
jgi:alanine dehydrogenase